MKVNKYFVPNKDEMFITIAVTGQEITSDKQIQLIFTILDSLIEGG